MNTPYGPLLSLRELEERQAEIRLAEAMQDVAAAETERAAARRLDTARQRAEAARVFLLEQRRQREAVETLHENVLDAAAQRAQRQEQAELDGLGGMAVMRREANDAR
jgi:flagellar biosynthesis chaperone FliJ